MSPATTSAGRKRRYGNEWMYPAENVVAVRPPGMKRATMMRYVPRCASCRSAQSNALWLFSPLKTRLTVCSPSQVPSPY